MPLPRTTNFCPICGEKLHGRLDKVYCSNSCRARYHRNKHEERQPVTGNIDAILHRNWQLLSEAYVTLGKKKFFIELTKLNRKGFHPQYFTSTTTNSKQKRYFYVYDFAWMMFSEKDVMVIKLDNPEVNMWQALSRNRSS